MPRPISIPKLTLHKASGKAVVRLSGTDVYCGIFGTPEAKAKYDREVAEWLARGRLADPSRHLLQAEAPTPGLSVNEVLLAYMRHAKQHYRRSDGTQTNEVNEYKQTFKVVQGLYGLTAAAEFGPLALKAVREEMVRRGWCRRLVNQRVNRVRRAFKRAAEEERSRCRLPETDDSSGTKPVGPRPRSRPSRTRRGRVVKATLAPEPSGSRTCRVPTLDGLPSG